VHYPELGDAEFVEPDVIDDGEVLASIPDGSLDFVAASHFIEHCEDPIGTIENHLQKLRPGGVLFLVVPDKRATFDAPRAVTPIDHLVRDHAGGPETSRRAHFEEWVKEAHGITDGADAEVERLLGERYSIHFHVWTPSAFLELVRYCEGELRLPFELECFERAGPEFFVVLSKRAEAQNSGQGPSPA
jgi:SAM-dependent methyltransferase